MAQLPGIGDAFSDDMAAFLSGQKRGVMSSNVATGQYDPKEQYLKVGFKSGALYGYHGISPQTAASFYSAPSKGKFIWDRFRKRGSVFGYQVPYSIISGESSHIPKYYASDEHREQHRQIGPSGHTPAEWQAGKGPYHPTYGMVHGPEVKHPEMQHRKVPLAYHADEEIPTAEHAPSLPFQKAAHSIYQRPNRRAGQAANPVSWMSSLWGGIKSLFGKSQHKADGGTIQGDGSAGDNVPVRATAGEGIIPKEDWPLIEPIWRRLTGKKGGGQGSHFAKGGSVSQVPSVPASPGVMDVRVLNFTDFDFSKPSGRGGRGGAGTGSGGGGDFSGVAIAGYIGNMLGGSGGAMLGAGLAKGDPVSGAMGAMKLFEDSLLKGPQIIKGFLAPFESQVSKYNPALVERFNLAVDNATAAIGKFLEPVIHLGTGLVDEFNVLVTAGVPDFREAVEAVTPLIRDLARGIMPALVDAMRKGANEVTSLFREFSTLGNTTAGVFRELIANGVRLGLEFAEVGRAVLMLTTFRTSLESATDAVEELAAAAIITSRILSNPAETTRQLAVNTPQGPWWQRAASFGFFPINPTIAGSQVVGQGGPDAPLWQRFLNFGSGYNAPGGGGGGGGLPGMFTEILADLRRRRPGATGEMTFAAQPARHVGIEELGQQARASAFSIGPEQQTADNTARAAEILRVIQLQLQQWGFSLPGFLNPPAPQIG